MFISDADLFVNDRLVQTNFQLSPTQEDTPGDGNCFVHNLLDQMIYDKILKTYKATPASLRISVVNSLNTFMKRRKIEWQIQMKILFMKMSMIIWNLSDFIKHKPLICRYISIFKSAIWLFIPPFRPIAVLHPFRHIDVF